MTKMVGEDTSTQTAPDGPKSHLNPLDHSAPLRSHAGRFLCLESKLSVFAS